MSSRLVDLDELVTVDEIALRLKMSVNAASNLVRGRSGRHKRKFPKPIVGRGDHGVWLWEDVAEWHHATVQRSTPRRPRATSIDYREPAWATRQRSA
jgi:hypothetical protein